MVQRYELVILDDGPPGSGPTDPTVEFRSNLTTVGEAVSTVGPPYAVSILVTLSEASTETIIVPLEFTGTATRGIDYLRTSDPNDPNGSPVDLSSRLSIAPGQTTAEIYIWVAPDADVENDEDIVLTIGETNTAGDTLTGAELGTRLTHTLTIADDDSGGNPVVFFAVDVASIQETDTNQTYNFDIALSSPAPSGGVTFDVVDTGAGTATLGVDYSGLPLTTVSIAEGETSTQQSITVIGNDTDNGDQTLVMGFANPSGNLTLPGVGEGDTHTLTILEDDLALNDTGTVYFIPGQPTELSEGQSNNYRIIYDAAGSGDHTEFDVLFSHAG